MALWNGITQQCCNWFSLCENTLWCFHIDKVTELIFQDTFFAVEECLTSYHSFLFAYICRSDFFIIKVIFVHCRKLAITDIKFRNLSHPSSMLCTVLTALYSTFFKILRNRIFYISQMKIYKEVTAVPTMAEWGCASVCPTPVVFPHFCFPPPSLLQDTHCWLPETLLRVHAFP